MKDTFASEQKEEFYKQRDDKNLTARLKQYGITRDHYFFMLGKQENRCAICREEVEKLVIDHCHKTGKVRGLLCSTCNSGLGFFRDHPDYCNRAFEYLINSKIQKAPRKRSDKLGYDKSNRQWTKMVKGKRFVSSRGANYVQAIDQFEKWKQSKDLSI